MKRIPVIVAVLLIGSVIWSCRQPSAPPIDPPQPRALSSAPPPTPVDYTCAFTESAVVIDGRIDEAAWKQATLIDRFSLPWLENNPAPRQATRARLLWDRQFLYFAAEMDDERIFTRPTAHNGRVWENDTFELFLKPAQDKPGYYEFEVNADNVTLELFIPDRDKGGYDQYKDKTRFKFETAVAKRTDGKGWSVEGRIRWSDLAPTGGRPEVNEVWQFALCRCDYSDADTCDLSTNARMKKRSFHAHEGYPTIRFAAPGSEKPFGIARRIPWTTSKVVGSPDPPAPYQLEPAFKNLKITQPIFVIEDPLTDDLLIIQHLGSWAGPGKILRVRNDPSATQTELVYDGPQELIYSLAFHPKHDQNGYVYVYSNSPLTGEHRFNRVTRYTMDRGSGKLDPASKLVVYGPFESNGHNGGGMEFGPKDGLLYFTTGDTSNDADQANRGQDLSYPGSAVIRIDVDNPAPGKAYSVPTDNPFLELKDACPEIWAHGFRNPWRMSFDRKTGTLWVGQNGQDLWEPVYVVKKGENYGWPVYEGSHAFHPHRKLETRSTLAKPIVEHHHSEARSLTGGVVYYGDKYPDLNGAYIYGDFSTGRIWAAMYDTQRHRLTWHREIARTSAQLVNFYSDRRGELLVCDDSGGVHRLVPAPKNISLPPFPRLLSQTGLFKNTAGHEVDSALIPYDINSPLWSDGAIKLRYIALPGDSKIDYTSRWGWNFPDGAVLVKTFALETEAGDPSSRRLLETRIMTRQGREWAGYTYLWNDEQTDAALAPAEGVDRHYSIKDPAAPHGVRQQNWHYPSRAECMVCHSRAANFILGPSELQMNRDVTYPGGVTDNQLRTLEHLGAFSAALLAKSPGELPRMPSPADTTAPLDLRARAYLHANCAHCHTEAGGGNASVDLEYISSREKTKMFNIAAQSNILGIPDARLIAPGHPDRSIVYQRMIRRGAGQMPPMASHEIDPLAKSLFKEWIEKMPPATK